MSATLYIIGAVIMAVLAALGIVSRKATKAERDRIAAAQGKANAETQKKFDKIDSGKPDVDAAIDRLSKRAGSEPKP